MFGKIISLKLKRAQSRALLQKENLTQDQLLELHVFFLKTSESFFWSRDIHLAVQALTRAKEFQSCAQTDALLALYTLNLAVKGYSEDPKHIERLFACAYEKYRALYEEFQAQGLRYVCKPGTVLTPETIELGKRVSYLAEGLGRFAQILKWQSEALELQRVSRGLNSVLAF